jgi:cell wall-associated NlpC family hydrolase
LKTFVYFTLAIVLFTSCKSASPISTSSSKKKEKTISKLADNIIDSASENLGVKYKTAGTTSAGFDCSGLVYSTFESFNIPLPRSSFQQAKVGIDLGRNISKAQKGDLIFFKTNHRSQINHVGIVTEVHDDELLFIHTSTSKGVIISSTKEPYYQKTFVQLNRVIL